MGNHSELKFGEYRDPWTEVGFRMFSKLTSSKSLKLSNFSISNLRIQIQIISEELMKNNLDKKKTFDRSRAIGPNLGHVTSSEILF